MRKFTWVVVAGLLGTITTGAQDRPDPIVTARVRSLLDLTGYVEYLGGLVGQADPAKQAAQLVRGLIDPDRGIEGIDPTRPIGLYGVLSPDVISSYAVVMIPVADDKAVMELLTGRLNLTLKKSGDIHELKLPNVPVPIFFRFANKSAYVTARSADPLADGKLLPPSDLFVGKEEAVATLKIYPDRVPVPLRRVALGQLELQLKQQAKTESANSTSPGDYGKRAGQEIAFAVIKSLIMDVDELAARIRIDPAQDDLSAEVVLKPKARSPIAKIIAGETGLDGVAGRIHRPGAVANLGVRIDLPVSVQKDLDVAVDNFTASVVNKEVGKEKQYARMAMDAITPTLKSRVIDLGLVVIGNDLGSVRAVAELRVKDGKEIARVLKESEASDPSISATSKFDVETVDHVALHTITYKNADSLIKTFGSPIVWLGTADDRLLISFGPDNELLKKVMASSSKPVPILQFDVGATKLFRLTNEGLPLGTLDKLVADYIGTSSDGKDTIRLAVTGGDALTIKVTTKGKVVRLAAMIDAAKKEQEK